MKKNKHTHTHTSEVHTTYSSNRKKKKKKKQQQGQNARETDRECFGVSLVRFQMRTVRHTKKDKPQKLRRPNTNKTKKFSLQPPPSPSSFLLSLLRTYGSVHTHTHTHQPHHEQLQRVRKHGILMPDRSKQSGLLVSDRKKKGHSSPFTIAVRSTTRTDYRRAPP